MQNKWVRTKSDEAAANAGCWFDQPAAERVRTYFEKHLRHSKGADANRPFVLLPWQWEDIIAPVYGWKMPDGTRRFRHARIFVPKKNGKSTLLSGVTLYSLTSDGEPGAEVYSAAGDREQAKIVYTEAANMAEASPTLSKLLRIRRSRNIIEYPAKRSYYKALSADAHTKEGFNIHCLAFDEIHTQPNSELWDTLKYGGAARRQPLYWMISTAGIQDDTAFWWNIWQEAKKIQSGEVVAINTLAVVYAADETDDPFIEATWRKANPSYGYTLNARSFEEDADSAKRNPAELSAFCRYRLDIPMKSASGWLGREYWDACQWHYEPPDLTGARHIDGIDLASNTDLTASADCYLLPDYLWVVPKFWIPTLKVQEREKSNKQRLTEWVERGYITETQTAYTDYDVMQADLLPFLTTAEEVAIDAWNFTQFAVNLSKALKLVRSKCTVTPVRTGFISISAATKELERLILARKIRFAPNPVLDWCFTNVVIDSDANGNRKPDKAKSVDKIDGIVAIILAIARFLTIDEAPKSKYETQGLNFMRLRV